MNKTNRMKIFIDNSEKFSDIYVTANINHIDIAVKVITLLLEIVVVTYISG